MDTRALKRFSIGSFPSKFQKLIKTVCDLGHPRTSSPLEDACYSPTSSLKMVLLRCHVIMSFPTPSPLDHEKVEGGKSRKYIFQVGHVPFLGWMGMGWGAGRNQSSNAMGCAGTRERL